MRTLVLLCVLIGPGLADAWSQDKPTSRDAAETRDQNLSRYKLGGFGQNATAALGVKVIFPGSPPQGATLSAFEPDSPAEKAGLKANDIILEVDGAAVGYIRERYYELWPRFGRSGTGKVEVLVSYLRRDGVRQYYYKLIESAAVGGSYGGEWGLPPDYWTTPKPPERDMSEGERENKARYVLDYGNFTTFSRYELGCQVQYSYNDGATIQSIKPGGAAASSGLKIGDKILEVDGAPVGVFNGRVYEVWRQYLYSTDPEVELLVCFRDPTTGKNRYYYPQIKLLDRTTGQ